MLKTAVFPKKSEPKTPQDYSLDVDTAARPLNILVLDDSPAACELLARALRKANPDHKIDFFSDEAEMEVALTGEYDVAFLDLHLSSQTGLELLQKSLVGLPSFPIVLITNDDDPAQQHLALDIGVADFVRKSEATPELLEKSARYCSNLFKQYHLREQMSAMERALSIDPFTGLNTLPFVFHRLNEWLQAKQDDNVAVGVLACQLHNIASVNRGLGFHRENQIAQQYCQWLKQHTPADAVVANTKDNQVIIAINSFSEQAVLELGQTLGQKTIAFELSEDAPAFSLAQCVGVTSSSDTNDNPEKIIQHALTALQAGQTGRKQCQLYAQSLHKDIEQRSIVVRDITRALQDKAIYFDIQPQFSVADGSLWGGELLMRWNHPELGMVNPQMVVEVAEATQQIPLLGAYALQSGLEHIRHWIDKQWLKPGMRIAVNVSAAELESNGYYEGAHKLLEQNQAAAQFLELEITESINLPDLEKTGAALNALRALGPAIAIDDFGTANANISQLCYIEADTVKLDKSIVDAADQGERAQKIYSSVQTLLHSLDAKIIAEGIETSEQLQLAKEIGIDIVQGFFLSKPLNLSDFEALLAKQASN